MHTDKKFRRPLLLCGFMGSGKDTFFRHLKQTENKYNYVVYAHPSDPTAFDFSRAVERIGFADQLKQDVHRHLKLEHLAPDAYEHCKNTKLCQEPSVSWATESKTLREYYRLYGELKRKEDPDYWIKILAETLDAKPEVQWVVTDFRFPNEAKFGKGTITARVFRGDVPIPASHITSERALDQFLTTFLILSGDTEMAKKEFQSCVSFFPQYRGFQPRVVLSSWK
jgi:hypothetical protein